MAVRTGPARELEVFGDDVGRLALGEHRVAGQEPVVIKHQMEFERALGARV